MHGKIWSGPNEISKMPLKFVKRFRNLANARFLPLWIKQNWLIFFDLLKPTALESCSAGNVNKNVNIREKSGWVTLFYSLYFLASWIYRLQKLGRLNFVSKWTNIRLTTMMTWVSLNWLRFFRFLCVVAKTPRRTLKDMKKPVRTSKSQRKMREKTYIIIFSHILKTQRS